MKKTILLLCFIAFLAGCREGKTARRVCRTHQTEVWEVAGIYYEEHNLTTNDFIDPRQLGTYFPNGQAPRCPVGTNPYAPFKIFDGPQCPYEPQSHSGERIPSNVIELKTNSP
jgi:hypothetical protein